jgi:RNA polymerase sigma-70 factor (ECF subfamily)
VGAGDANVRGGARSFKTTQWTLVRAAGDTLDPRSEEALAGLCELYWYPIYAFIRRGCVDADKAQDLTQGFFTHLLERKTLKAANQERGRFRSFLLGSLKYFLADERDRAQARKRGGGHVVVSLELDVEAAEGRYQLEADAGEGPERMFARRWAFEVLALAYQRLEEETAAGNEPERGKRLAQFLTGEGETVPYRQVGEELGMSESAVKVAVHRLKKRFGALLREEVARTVAEPAEVDDELRFLLQSLGS